MKLNSIESNTKAVGSLASSGELAAPKQKVEGFEDVSILASVAEVLSSCEELKGRNVMHMTGWGRREDLKS